VNIYFIFSYVNSIVNTFIGEILHSVLILEYRKVQETGCLMGLLI